jgi:hypothetical protein
MENIDFILNGQANGNVATRLMANGMDTGALRPWLEDNGKAYVKLNGHEPVQIANADTLRKDEWKELDTNIVQAATQRLIGVQDLVSRGMVTNVANGLGKTLYQYETESEFTAAEMNMDAITRSAKDRPEFVLNSLPLPVVSKDFSFNIRSVAASRTGGESLSMRGARLASRQVAEYIENMLFNGTSSYAFGGGTIYGYTDHPQKNSVTLSTNWDASAKTGEQIVDDVREMKQKLIDDRHLGPYVLYVPTAYETVLDDDFKAASDKTIRQRILEIGNISEVKVADKLTANKCVLVEMDGDYISMVQGLPLQTLNWNIEGGLVMNFKVMTIMVPLIIPDQNGRLGVCVLSA